MTEVHEHCIQLYNQMTNLVLYYENKIDNNVYGNDSCQVDHI